MTCSSDTAGVRHVPAVSGFALLLLWILGTAQPVLADEPLRVVTTLPVLKDFVEQVGTTHVRVTSLLTGLENEHSYSPKPSDLVALRKTRLFIQIGAGLEVWVDGLIRSAGNREMATITAAEGIELLAAESPPTAPSYVGSAHRDAGGNPHIWLDPEIAVSILSRITETLSRLLPSHAAEFSRNHAAYVVELRRTTADLTEQLKALPDRRIITHHPAWPYFARRFDLEIVGDIQTQSGSEPSPRHIQVLVERIRRDHLRVIVSEPQLSQKVPQLLSQETGARVALLTALPGGLPRTDTYLDMLRYNVLQLLRAFKGA